MRIYFSILPLICFFQLTSCSEEKTTEKKDVETDYFSDTKIKNSADDFKNEMATGETDSSDLYPPTRLLGKSGIKRFLKKPRIRSARYLPSCALH